MPRLKSMFLIGLAVAALLSLSLTALYLLFSKDHIEFIRWFLNSIHKPHLQQTASSYLPQQQFFLLRLVAVVFSMGILLLLFIFYKKRTLIITRTQQLTEHVQCLIIGFFKRSIPSGKLNSLLFLLLITFYFIFNITIFYVTPLFYILFYLISFCFFLLYSVLIYSIIFSSKLSPYPPMFVFTFSSLILSYLI